MSRDRTPVEVAISAAAWSGAVGHAGGDPMRETGGVLLGWRTSDHQVVVVDMVEVKDPRSGHTAYRRRHARAQTALDEAIASHPTDSPMGYVGEWHTHPAPVGPSLIDRFELRRISKKTPGLIALVVCAYDASKTHWHPAGLAAAVGRTHPATITIEQGTADA